MLCHVLQNTSECIDHYTMTVSFTNSSCAAMTVSVPWPATTASLSRRQLCSQPRSISVRAVNTDGLAGPATEVLVPPTMSRPPPPLSNNTSTPAVRQTATTASWSYETPHYVTGGEVVYSSCRRGSESDQCRLSSHNSPLQCSLYVLTGRVLIINRTETSIAVQLTSAFSIPLHTGLVLVRISSLM